MSTDEYRLYVDDTYVAPAANSARPDPFRSIAAQGVRMKKFATAAEAITYIEGRTWWGWEVLEVVKLQEQFGIVVNRYPLLQDGQVDVAAAPAPGRRDDVVWTRDLGTSDPKTLFPRHELGYRPN